jgi:cell fate regulator YaaT (PSP1 superfamily)
LVEVVGIRFKRAGKIYYFSSGDLALDVNDKVIVETARGVEFGELVIPPRQVTEEEVILPLKPVIRKASTEDERIVNENRAKEKEAFQICLKKITEHQLPMKLVDVEYTFDGNKIIFSFTSEGRVDFRELVKDLAAVFRTRIELRQIGVRDEAKMLGGVGSCGRILCCASFLGDFEPVSIRMAKDQKLSLNPTKISGICGRLMCCLKYENSIYDEENREHCRGNCGGHSKDPGQEDDELLEMDPDSMNQAVPVSGKGRFDGRQKKGEKNKGKSEKV